MEGGLSQDIGQILLILFIGLIAGAILLHGIITLKTGKYFSILRDGTTWRTFSGKDARKYAWANLISGIALLLLTVFLLAQSIGR